MSQNKYRIVVLVPLLDESTVSAVYRAVWKRIPGEHEDGWLSVYPYDYLEQEPSVSTQLLVLEFASLQTLKKIGSEPLVVNGEKLELSEFPSTGKKKADSASIALNGPLSNPTVFYEAKGICDDDLATLEMLLSPASGIQLRYLTHESRLQVTFPHLNLANAQAKVNEAVQYLIELREQNGSPDITEDETLACLKQELDIRKKKKIDNSNVPKAVVEKVQCPICFDDIDGADFRKLPCGHVMHGDCYSNFIKNHFYKCPQCQKVISTPNGNQPDNGFMSVRNQKWKLGGHEKDSTGTYEIEYNFPNGTQTERHPTPGAPYYGTYRVAYLPMSKEGERVLKLLDKAFEARLTFTIGTSNTTGANNAVVWNNIHHKTSSTAGPYGYPDPGYLKRVTEELAAVGITDLD